MTPRKLFVPVVVSTMMMCAVSAQDTGQLAKDAAAAYDAKAYEQSGFLYAAAVVSGAASRTNTYNAACSFALAGRSDLAFEFLDRAIAAGWTNVGHLEADTDLDSLRKDARWSKMMAAARAAEDELGKGVKLPELRRELLDRMAEDQKFRMTMTRLMRENDDGTYMISMDHPALLEFGNVDERNTARMKDIIKQHGWPGKSLVGKDGSHAAWLLVQHADADPEFQNHCLALIATAQAQGEATAVELAYLTDRVRVAQGKPQVYGTQFRTENGEFGPAPIEDPDNVDKRRQAIGLGTLAEYARSMQN